MSEKVPCTFCEQPTLMLGTKMCDNCWELRSRLVRLKLDRLISWRTVLDKIVESVDDR